MLSGNMYVLRAEGARKIFVFTIHYYQKRKVPKFSGIQYSMLCPETVAIILIFEREAEDKGMHTILLFILCYCL